ncbi:MAG: hypothetical protein JWQ69_4992 [Pseudomonas sp.]|nr:hypothetical protein [Pseudomonas sp.]
MSLGTTDKIMLCAGLIGFSGLFIFIGAALHLAYTQIDMMVDRLKNCPAVTIRAFLIKAGPWGRLHVLGVMMGLMITPRIFLRSGGASTEDLKNFPADLKRKLIVLHWFGWTAFLMIVGVVAIDELILA